MANDVADSVTVLRAMSFGSARATTSTGTSSTAARPSIPSSPTSITPERSTLRSRNIRTARASQSRSFHVAVSRV